MVKKQTATKKVKKKKWYPILAPKILNEKVLGESLLTESSSMKGRYITMNLMNITGDPKKQIINLQFRIKDVKEGQGITEIVKYELLPSAVKRLVRRGKSKIDDSFPVNTKDGLVRVKTLTITNSMVYKSIATNLRATTKTALKEILSKNTFENSIDELLKGTILKDVKTKISKITPIRAFNIRILKIENKGREEKGEVAIKEAVSEEIKETTEETEEKVEKKEKPKKATKKEEPEKKKSEAEETTKEEKKEVKKKTTPKKK
ncbi:MAG: hypothetical protein KJ583_00820 [Nanoarchaeota archaeon]|nr:hypothetical protein [Nanoarchaeota archaeon]MBU1270155.1 hypothetical protein [Nanoarchaeota archaeon]MBU1603832.1 hypothetical protein [Nanoarchaeota archaeon]MBU2443304.1 hypothetical protein [Nanoarchaeota archaeon]